MFTGVERKWLLACAAVACGEAIGLNLGGWGALWPCAAMLAAAFALLPGNRTAGLCCTLLFLGTALAMHSVVERRNLLREAESGLYRAEVKVGKVSSQRAKDGRTIHSFKTDIGGVRARVVIDKDGVEAPQPGETWVCEGWLKRLDVDDLTRERLFWVTGRPASARRLRPASAVARFFTALRENLSRRVAIGLGHDPMAVTLNRAILLGERAEMPPDVRSVFQSAGMVHVFAISGLHVMIVAQVILFLFVWLPYRTARMIAIPLLWFYVLLAGSAPSAVRAAAMASLYFAAPVFWRQPNSVVAWSATFLAVHLCSPVLLANAGCLLSFAVMLSLVLASRAAHGLEGWRSRLVFALTAWAAGVPIVAHTFAHVTPGGLLANLVLIPAAEVSVWSGILGILASCVWTPLAAHLNNLSALFTNAMVLVSRAVAALPGADLAVGRWTAWQCAAWYAEIALGLLLAYLIRRRRVI